MSIDWELTRMKMDGAYPFVVYIKMASKPGHIGGIVAPTTYSAQRALDIALSEYAHPMVESVSIKRNGLTLWQRPCQHDFERRSPLPLPGALPGNGLWCCKRCALQMGMDVAKP